MIDMNREVPGLLKDICAVQLAFPEIDSSFPYVSLTEIDNSSAAVLSGAERFSHYACQIDVWDTSKSGRSPSRCSQLAGKVSAAMISAGFKRGAGKLTKGTSGNPHRYMMSFTGWVDNKEKKVYGGGF